GGEAGAAARERSTALSITLRGLWPAAAGSDGRRDTSDQHRYSGCERDYRSRGKWPADSLRRRGRARARDPVGARRPRAARAAGRCRAGHLVSLLDAASAPAWAESIYHALSLFSRNDQPVLPNA